MFLRLFSFILFLFRLVIKRQVRIDSAVETFADPEMWIRYDRR